MEKVTVLVVKAEITRDNHNYTLLPVFKDVAHLRIRLLHHPSSHLLPKDNTVVKEVRQVCPLVGFWC